MNSLLFGLKLYFTVGTVWNLKMTSSEGVAGLILLVAERWRTNSLYSGSLSQFLCILT